MDMSNTTFKRVKREKNYTTIPTHCLRNPKLSWGAKGLHSYILQLPDDWEINMEDLRKRAANGKSSLSTLVKELMDHGYFDRKEKPRIGGRFNGYEYIVYEIPSKNPTATRKTVSGETVSGETVSGKPDTTKYERDLVLKLTSSIEVKKEILRQKINDDTIPNRMKIWEMMLIYFKSDEFINHWNFCCDRLPPVNQMDVMKDWILNADWITVHEMKINKIRGWIKNASSRKRTYNGKGNQNTQKNGIIAGYRQEYNKPGTETAGW